MEMASLGGHTLSVCPFCNKLFDCLMEPGEGMDVLMREYREHLAATPECDAKNKALPTMDDLRESLGPSMEAASRDREQRIDSDPNNGRTGYWLVEGIRHDARCKASSAREAIEKCSSVVQDWESPEVMFIGEELPEVF